MKEHDCVRVTRRMSVRLCAYLPVSLFIFRPSFLLHSRLHELEAQLRVVTGERNLLATNLRTFGLTTSATATPAKTLNTNTTPKTHTDVNTSRGKSHRTSTGTAFPLFSSIGTDSDEIKRTDIPQHERDDTAESEDGVGGDFQHHSNRHQRQHLAAASVLSVRVPDVSFGAGNQPGSGGGSGSDGSGAQSGDGDRFGSVSRNGVKGPDEPPGGRHRGIVSWQASPQRGTATLPHSGDHDETDGSVGGVDGSEKHLMPATVVSALSTAPLDDENPDLSHPILHVAVAAETSRKGDSGGLIFSKTSSYCQPESGQHEPAADVVGVDPISAETRSHLHLTEARDLYKLAAELLQN
jgi:hypothetical protein